MRHPLHKEPVEAIFLKITNHTAHSLVSLWRKDGQIKSVMQYTGESKAICLSVIYKKTM